MIRPAVAIGTGKVRRVPDSKNIASLLWAVIRLERQSWTSRETIPTRLANSSTEANLLETVRSSFVARWELPSAGALVV